MYSILDTKSLAHNIDGGATLDFLSRLIHRTSIDSLTAPCRASRAQLNGEMGNGNFANVRYLCTEGIVDEFFGSTCQPRVVRQCFQTTNDDALIWAFTCVQDQVSNVSSSISAIALDDFSTMLWFIFMCTTGVPTLPVPVVLNRIVNSISTKIPTRQLISGEEHGRLSYSERSPSSPLPFVRVVAVHLLVQQYRE